MPCVEKFINDNGKFNAMTKKMELINPDRMQAIGITEPLWKGLVAINILYKQGFKINNVEIINKEKILKIPDTNNALGSLFRSQIADALGEEVYKDLRSIHDGDLLKIAS